MTAKDREQGFLEEIAKYPNISVPLIYHLDDLEELSEQMLPGDHQDDSEKEDKLSQEEAILYLLEQHPDLKAIYTTNLDTTQLVADALKEAEREDLIFVGYDGGEEQMELLEDEIVNGLIIQNPYGMGYATVVAAIRTTLGLPNESFVNSGFTWVTTINKEDKEIKPMLY
jgi:ribose transport system substrate-binding protein